jgi:isocitrate dehydrogenase
MARIMWSFIKNKLILPYLDVDLKYYGFGMESRDALTPVRQYGP